MKGANYFSSASDAYKKFRPTYPKQLYEYLASLSPASHFVCDCGCGNGQASVQLAELFDSVLASDISAEQIAEAQQRENIRYIVSPGETINADDASVDLVTIAQAIHWFDHSRFFQEVDRVLKPGGILAAWGYQLMYSDTPLDAVVERFHSDIVGPFWPKGREFLDEGYSKISFPYPRLETPRFKMQCHWQFKELIGYLNTWSAVKAYEQQNNVNPLTLVEEELQNAWGDKNQQRQIYWPLILYVGKKPC